MEQTLAHCVQYSLQNFLYENATFMAERLYAQEKSDLAKYLLASCYFKAGQFYKVCALLKGSLYERNRYLLAMACYRMGKHREAELALTDHFPAYTGHPTPTAATAVSPLSAASSSTTASTSTSTSASPFIGSAANLTDEALLDRVPNGAAGLFLLGQICKKQDQPERAKQCFQKCLALNPFLWSAFESLCEIGSEIEAEEIFGVDATSASAVQSPLDIEMSESEQVMENAAKITRDQTKKAQPVTLQVPEVNEPKAPRLVKTRSCVTQTTTPAIALRLFRQTPSKDRERERTRRASEERKSGVALAQQSATVEDSLPSLEDTPGNFFLSTVNLRRSPFQGRYGKSSDYDPDGFTPSQKSLVQPSHQARQKALHARREKTQRHKRALDGTEAPKFNISRPGQLFHDEEASSPQVVRSTSNVSTTTASSTTANGSQRNPPVSPYPAKFFQTENMALSLNQFLAQKKGPTGSVQSTPQSVMKQPSSALEQASPFASVPNTPVSPELDEVRSTSAPRRSPNRDANGEPLSNESSTAEEASQPTGADSTIEVENEAMETESPSSASNRLPRELLEEAFGDDDGLTSEGSETTESQCQEQDEAEANQLIEGATQVLSLLRVIGKAYTHMCRYDSLAAVEEFQKLPKDQFETGYVLCKVGKCYFEVVQYHKSKKMFELVRKFEPYRTEDMEIYSTILWQLNEPVPLSYLAQQLVELDKQSPSTWCAVGNCFSLQKDHDSALKFFKRAIQVQPDFTYAYTLCGHEQVAGDNWDKALAFYRSAIRIDARHYNAWYGLGMIYFRQEKYSIAEYHFNKALEINCKNSVLYCYLGMVLRVSRRYEEAEIMLGHALKIDPNNALARYKKAVVLVNLGKLQPALSELFLLQESSPKEAPTCYLIGRVYKRMGQLDKASYYFTLAMDFDTKSSWTRSIKQSIAKLGTPDVEGGDVEATDKDTEDLEDLK